LCDFSVIVKKKYYCVRNLKFHSFIIDVPKSEMYQWHEHMLALLFSFLNVPLSNRGPETRPVTVFEALYVYSQSS